MCGRKISSPTYMSLFCGCGGLDLGFIQAGFQCIVAFDTDKTALINYASNIDKKVYQYDLSKGTLPKLPIRKRPEVLLAGPPCQGFSTAGKRNFTDPRNSLLNVAYEVAKSVNPQVVVVENVPGVIARPHNAYWEDLIVKLNSIGYDTKELTCVASRLGLAQIRKRHVLIGWKTNRNFPMEPSPYPSKDLKDVLTGLSRTSNHVTRYLPEDSYSAKIAKHIKPGQKLSNVRGGPRSVHTWNIPEVFGNVTETERSLLESIMRIRRKLRTRNVGDADPVSMEYLMRTMGFEIKTVINSLIDKGFLRKAVRCVDLVNTFNGKFRRLVWNAPSLSVDTRFGNPTYFLHPSEDRGFTVREAARIQGFPDSYYFYGSESVAYRLIGNAVPPPVGNHIASVVLELLE